MLSYRHYSSQTRSRYCTDIALLPLEAEDLTKIQKSSKRAAPLAILPVDAKRLLSLVGCEVIANGIRGKVVPDRRDVTRREGGMKRGLALYFIPE